MSKHALKQSLVCLKLREPWCFFPVDGLGIVPGAPPTSHDLYRFLFLAFPPSLIHAQAGCESNFRSALAHLAVFGSHMPLAELPANPVW